MTDEQRIPLTDVTLGEEEAAAAARVIRSGWLTMGGEVEAFEREFAQAVGARHAIAVSNGTAALRLAYYVNGLGPGMDFALPALTFVATLAAGLELGGRPLLIDCTSENDLTLSPEDLLRKLTPATRVVTAMAYGGHPPAMERIGAICAGHGATLVEDACHAPLATAETADGARAIGTFGACGCFSFFSNKNMATGEGGMLVTGDDALAQRLRRLRSHGMTTVTWDRERGHATEYDVVERGWNDRMDEVRAAMGREQLRKLPAANAARRAAAARLRMAIDALDHPGLTVPLAGPTGTPAAHLFVIALPPGTDRPAFRAALAGRGIQTSIHYPAFHRFSGLKQWWPEGPEAVEAALPVFSRVQPRLVTLPLGPSLTADQIRRIAEAVGAALR